VNKERRKRVRERKVEKQKERYVENEQCVGRKITNTYIIRLRDI
jgi:hypothetical protein